MADLEFQMDDSCMHMGAAAHERHVHICMYVADITVAEVAGVASVFISKLTGIRHILCHIQYLQMMNSPI